MPEEHQEQFKIQRSFSRKVNLGNYESADFFCSAAHTFYDKPTPKEQNTMSQRLAEFCETQVKKDINYYKNKQARRDELKEKHWEVRDVAGEEYEKDKQNYNESE